MESTDSELIELLERKAPEHLTIEEIERLSARLDQSPELQTFLLEQLQMEQYLAAALSRIDVRVDDIIAGRRTTVNVAEQGGGRFGMTAAVAILVCGVVAGGVVWYRSGRTPPVPPPVVDGRTGTVTAEGAAAGAEKQPAGGETQKPTDGTALPESVARSSSDEKKQPVDAPRSPVEEKKQQGTDSPRSASGEEAKQQGGDGGSPAGVEKVKAAPPWEAALAAAPQDWRGVVLAPPPSRGAALSGAEAAQWLEPKGALSKLRAPWPADAMLRLRVPRNAPCEVRLWKGTEGALFQLTGNAGWQSYRAEREPAAAEPKWREVCETDDGLYWKFHSVEITDFKKSRGKIHFNRTVHPNDTTVDLFWHDGVVQLWRGDLRLASAPLAGPPDEVDFKLGQALEHLSMTRIEKPPSQPRHVPELALDSPQPASLAWNRQAAAPATIENVPVPSPLSQPLPKGERGQRNGLKISVPEGAQPARVWLPLPKPGICDVVFEIQSATHGTGVYLGGADGAPIVGLQLTESSWPGHLEAALTNPWDGTAPVPGAAAAQSTPTWVRLLPASGVLKCWISRNGRHWAYVGAKPLPAVGPPLASLGVYVAAGTKPPRSLTLAGVQVRDYSGLNSLAPAELLARAPSVASPTIAAWKQTATQSLPSGVDRGAWHRAVALRTIAAGAPLDVCSWLLRALLKDAGAHSRSVEQNQRLLAEFPDVAQMTVAVLPWEGRSPHPMVADLVEAADDFAEMAQAEGETRPFAKLGRQVVAARLGPFPELSYPFPDSLVLPELMQMAAAERYDDMEETARTVQLYARDNVASVAQWAIELAARRRRGDKTSLPPLAGVAEGQLSVDTTKAQQMFMDDLMGAARSGQMARAGQLITYLEPAAPSEMYSDPGDPMVYVTPAAQIAALLVQYPALAAQMKQTAADKGRLRVRFAIADNDLRKVMHATTQFAGTPAATEGFQWIGDLLLSSGAQIGGGDAAGALAWYERALPTADIAQRDQLAARLRLAHAAAGREFGSPVHFRVRLGDRELTAEEFEALVAKARKEARPAVVAVPQQAPAASGFRIEPLALAAADRPWQGAGRVALAVAGETLVAQDSRTVAAWDLAANKPRWQRPLGDGSGLLWRPRIDGAQVVVAAPVGGAAQLQQLDLTSGEPRGKPVTVQGACFAGYSPAVRGAIAVGFATRPHPSKSMLLLCGVDLNSGENLREAALLPRTAEAAGAATCPPLVADNAVLAFVDGGIVCCETAGVVRWVRRQYAVGGKEAAAGGTAPTVSLLVDGDAIVWQPRVPYIERIDLANGHRKWMRMLPEIRRILGMADGRLMVEANGRLVALSAADGKLLWNKPTGELLGPAAVGMPGGVLVTRAKVVRPADAGNPQPLLCPELVWFDGVNGQMRGVWPLESLTGEHLALGPWVVHNGAIFTFFGTGKNGQHGVQWEPARQLLRLNPQGAAQPPREDSGALESHLQAAL